MARVPGDMEPERVNQAFTAAMRSVPSPLVGDDGYLPRLALVDGAQGAQPVREGTARLLYFLLGVVAVVLLIACVNLASLMLARGVSRQRELAVRRALGGGRGRLLRQLMLEAVVLATAGAAAASFTSRLTGTSLPHASSSSARVGTWGGRSPRGISAIVRPPQVPSWSSTGTPSRVRKTSDSRPVAPISSARRNASSVFSGAWARAPRWAKPIGNKAALRDARVDHSTTTALMFTNSRMPKSASSRP